MAMLDMIADDIEQWLTEGQSIRSISVRCSDKCETLIPEPVLTRWLDTDERRAMLTRARTRAADRKAEGAVDRSTDLVRDVALGLRGKEDIAAAKLANDTDRWIAGVWNRERYGEQTAAGVTINVTTLHLDSLRVAAAPERPGELGHGRAKLMGDVVDVEAKPVISLSDLL
ncbi:MAG TPA: hypothetical protein VJ840_18675 [Gemmatimonadaceae bacterium]|nr:hypothetical protein [Gemmatimonadaceae bacterium]